MRVSDKSLFLLVVLTTTILHVGLAVWAPLSGDEAYYWDCSRHLDWSYFDQPPLVIWAMIPFRALLGETNLAVRSPAILASLLIALSLVPIIRRLGGGFREAGLAYLLLHTAPLVFLGSSYASTDIVMIAAYSLAASAAMSVADGDTRGWWGFGLAIGLGFLAKFPMVLSLAAIVAAVIWGEGKRHLRTMTPYLAAILALICTTPVWIWAVQHNWDNILFQLSGRHVPTEPTPWFFGEYLGANLILLSPVLAVALAAACWRALRRPEPAWRVAAVAAVTPFVFFGLLSLRSRMSPHWGAPGVVVASAILILMPVRWRRGVVIAGIVIGLLLTTSLLAVVAWPHKLLEIQWTYSGRPGRVRTSAAAAMIGNEEIAAEVARRLRPDELVASSSYSTVHLLSFLSGGELPTRLVKINLGFHGFASLYWHRPEDLVGRDFLFVAYDRRGLLHQPLTLLFAEVIEQPPIEIRRQGRVIRSLRVLRCRDLLSPSPVFTRL
jgi:4-amino-4-deoxy-L-arabinose transferase-like glycosyltransferase